MQRPDALDQQARLQVDNWQTWSIPHVIIYLLKLLLSEDILQAVRERQQEKQNRWMRERQAEMERLQVK